MKAFLAGLGTGIALGILFAPQRGSETRQQVRAKAGELSDIAKEQLGTVQEYARDLQEQAGNLGRKVADVAQTAGSQMRQAAETIVSEAGAGVLTRLNTASREELMSISGIGPVLADNIIAGRPFSSAQQVLNRGILPEGTFKELTRQFSVE